MQNKKLNVEVRTERAHKTMAMLEERYRNSNKEPIHFQLLKVQRYQALMYYGQQAQVDALIKADKQPDGSEGHLSDIEHTKFHTMTEASIRAESKVQRDRMPREQLRVQNKRQNTQTTNHAESNNGAPNQTKPIGQAQEKKGEREERACPYCKVMPAPHRFSQCPMKASNQTTQAEERV
ncbi:hypothetical protein SARC_03451 [Sphaeroforma arctica JP610]|uniref:Uncharacterized protein n=1 Tax=Sphaeroforma arctica JP610 TaxID=667725 RepID=A0A0L0G5L5_9EUKA|nr:hypothetical protein SARC_03451 [Sphaeroforma arctica JP610]KNC84327.1 hypothetical protein SARC_03451 [Sphaeroforma arctica JP610]|eukprot:XP_014158229.1 hypothetical protein SARC_03451 [Sphaeroforma arctica JP610]